MKPRWSACLLMLFVAIAVPPVSAESVAQIMAKVAENQIQAQEMRRAFTYNQSVLIRMKRGGGKLAREEMRELTVTPTPTGFEKTLTHFAGKYRNKGKMIEYSDPHYTYKEMDIDGDIASDLAEDLTDDKDSRDGIAADLFPLTAEQQKKYDFKLEGKQSYRGRDVYRITFTPAKEEHGDAGCWAGEVLVDTREFQPVLVTTYLARGIPLWVRTVLGTNLKHLGFKVTYQRIEDGIWFPASYGGEFEVRALFFYKRRISLSMLNTDFRRTDVTSGIIYGKSLQ
jgi:hypothetical protein